MHSFFKTAATAAAMAIAAVSHAQPANDHCANAIPLANNSVTPFNPLGATRDVTLPCDQFPEGAIDVWFTYTTAGPETFTVTTCGGPTQYLTLGVFDACGGQLVGCDSWSCNAETQSEVSIVANQARTYYICVVSYEGVEGDSFIAINAQIVIPPPPNDTCATAQAINAAGSYPFDSTSAATNGGPSICSINGRPSWNDVYFRYTAPADGWVRFDTLQQPLPLNTIIEVLDGCGGAVLACNDDADWSGQLFNYRIGSITCPLQVSANASYIVRVATSSTTAGGGPGILRVTNVPGPIVYAPPANAIPEPGPACDEIYATDINYGCNPRVTPIDRRATEVTLCQTRKGHISARTTPIEDGTIIHDFDAYHFTLTAPDTIRVRGQSQFVGVVTFQRLPCGTGTIYTGQIGQNMNPACGAAEFDLTWNLPAGEYVVGFGVAPVGVPTCGTNDEYWFTVSGSAPCQPAACGPSDIAGPNQSIGADGTLSADDIIVFLGWFFAGDTRADVAGPNQSTTPDGSFTADDIIVFLGRYFEGC